MIDLKDINIKVYAVAGIIPAIFAAGVAWGVVRGYAQTMQQQIQTVQEQQAENKKDLRDTINIMQGDHDRIGTLEGDIKVIKEKMNNIENNQAEWKKDYDSDMKEIKSLIRNIPP